MQGKFWKILSIGAGVVALIALGLSFKSSGLMGSTPFTQNTQNSSYTETAAAVSQNVQAISERMAGGSQYQILQADSKGVMQNVLPTALAGDWTISGNLRAASLVQTGAVADLTATAAVTAAQVCDSTLLRGTAVTGTPTYTLPSTTTLFADCLTTNGDMKMLGVLSAATTGTVYAAGTGGTLLYSSTTTVAAGKGGLLRVIRDSATTYTAILLNAAN